MNFVGLKVAIPDSSFAKQQVVDVGAAREDDVAAVVHPEVVGDRVAGVGGLRTGLFQINAGFRWRTTGVGVANGNAYLLAFVQLSLDVVTTVPVIAAWVGGCPALG